MTDREALSKDQWKSLTFQQRLQLTIAWWMEFAPKIVIAWLSADDQTQDVAIATHQGGITAQLRGDACIGVTLDWCREKFTIPPQKLVPMSMVTRFFFLKAERKARLERAVREIARDVDPSFDLDEMFGRMAGEAAKLLPKA